MRKIMLAKGDETFHWKIDKRQKCKVQIIYFDGVEYRNIFCFCTSIFLTNGITWTSESWYDIGQWWNEKPIAGWRSKTEILYFSGRLCDVDMI